MLSARENGPEVGFGENASDFFPFVSLNFNVAIFYRAANSANLLHRTRQTFLLWQTDANESFDYCYRLATTPGFLPDDIHPSTAFAQR